ncbi:MAG TPA: prepilin-type N-terminal cleavage/methylation domain-containing protein [Gemmataceae bacterium]|jgi:type II secretory pathway pseudopilin PulG
MKRRQAFTLVELLVAMALIMFIMAILSQAFVQATGTFRNLKSTGDMAEKLRATTQLLQRDLSADHFEGKKRLSNPNFWLNGPPEQGFFQILQGSAGTPESLTGDVLGINSFVSTNHSLAFTIKLRGNQMGDFPSTSAAGGGAILSAIPTFGPTESRYQTTSGGAYNYQWAEVAWFLQPSMNLTTGAQDATVTDTQNINPLTGQPYQPVPLWTLVRRQRLLVPDNSLVQPAQPIANAAQFLETSCWPNGANLYFNNPIDITDPQRRFGGGTGAYQSLVQQGATGALAGADIQLTDVISFDVRLLIQGVTPGVNAASPDPFVTLFAPLLTTPVASGGYHNANPAFPITGPLVFDTWSSINDGLGNSYAQWNVGGQATGIPLWNGTSGPIIQAIQISIRIWDLKTNQTRQVTIVQAM